MNFERGEGVEGGNMKIAKVAFNKCAQGTLRVKNVIKMTFMRE